MMLPPRLGRPLSLKTPNVGNPGSYGYMQLLQGVIQRKGIPLTLYSDRHSTFTVSRAQNETLEEQLTGQTPQTQVGRALNELGVRLVLAHSPQAKGRIERLWGTFQDRLLMELRLAGASTLEEANAVLADFLPRFNSRFGVPAAQPGAAYQCVPAGTDLAGILCFKYQRTVAADNTVRFEGRTSQILPDPHQNGFLRGNQSCLRASFDQPAKWPDLRFVLTIAQQRPFARFPSGVPGSASQRALYHPSFRLGDLARRRQGSCHRRVPAQPDPWPLVQSTRQADSCRVVASFCLSVLAYFKCASGQRESQSRPDSN